MSNFTPSSKKNPCRVCGVDDGRCREQGNLLLCMSVADQIGAPAGYSYRKQTKDGLWGIFAPDNGYKTQSEYDRHRAEINKLRAAKAWKQKQIQARSLSPTDRDRHYRAILKSLTLHPDDRADCHRRGLTDDEIEAWGIKSVVKWQRLTGKYPANLPGIGKDGRSLAVGGDGYLCPIKNVDGLIVGFQLRLRSADNGGRYRWLSSDNNPVNLGGELPLAVHRPQSPDATAIALVEGTGAKPFIVSQRFNQVTIGAAGGLFASSPKTLKATLDKLSAELGTKVVRFYPDAGAVLNQAVVRQYRATWELLKSLGYAVEVGWWGQLVKGSGDADEIVPDTPIDWIPPQDFWKLPEIRIADRLSKRLKRKPDIRVKTADLSTAQLEAIPERGIIALASGKGTGKTKFIASQVEGGGAALAFTHLRSLTQNLCYRLGLDYRNDLFKLNGRFASGEGYTLRVGSCVQALLAVDPDQFEGCDLVVDEVTQVLKTLLTSSTCNHDGSRALLLERFKRLIQVAKRVIIADADLDDRTLDYLEELRGDGSKAFLIRNDYQGKGYSVEVDRSPTKDGIVGRLLKAVKEDLGSGKPNIVFTDSYRFSKTLAKLTEGLGAKTLLVNRDTSGGEAEQEFITRPDEVLARRQYDVIICSPSLTTGVNIERQGAIAAVWGIFQGASLEDSDLAQMLARVRPGVRRYVWVAQAGRFFSKISQSTNLLEIKGALHNRTKSVVVAQFQQGLAFPVGNNLDKYDFAGNPHLNYWAGTIADRNFSAWNLRSALSTRLKLEGHQVTVIQGEADSEIRKLLTDTRQAIRESDAQAIVRAENLTLERYLSLKDKDGLTGAERLAVEKYSIADFYCIPVEQVNLELVLFDCQGRSRGELVALEDLIYGTAAARVAAGIEKQVGNGGITPWDLSDAELKRSLRAELGLDQFLDPDKQWTAGDMVVKQTADRIRANSGRVKSVLNFTVKAEISDLQLINQLLRQLGVKTASTRCRVEGKKSPPRVYTLDKSHWEKVRAILERREAKRLSITASDPPPLSSDCKQGGGSAQIPDLARVPLKELARYSISDLQELASWLEDGIVSEQNFPPAIVQLARSRYRAA